MTEILYKLHECQSQACQKGIDFDIDMRFDINHEQRIDVKVYCSIAGDTSEAHMFHTTFTTGNPNNKARLEKIYDFISSTTLYSE